MQPSGSVSAARSRVVALETRMVLIAGTVEELGKTTRQPRDAVLAVVRALVRVARAAVLAGLSVPRSCS